jgi:putative redox protein
MQQDGIKESLGKTIEAIKKNPATASLVFRAHTELREGVSCSVKVRDFEPIMVDEPPDLGGKNAAMNPVEMVLGALGTCQEIMYAAYAAVMGIPITKLSVNLKGYLDLRGLFALDEAVVPGLRKVTYETCIESPASPEAIEQLVAMVEGHCPVLDSLTRPVEVKGCVTVNGVKRAP